MTIELAEERIREIVRDEIHKRELRQSRNDQETFSIYYIREQMESTKDEVYHFFLD